VERGESLNDCWSKVSSEGSGSKSANNGPLVQVSGVQAAVQGHEGLWPYSDVAYHILVLLASAFLMLLMLVCLPECKV
jgi:hypothetical protein